MSEQTIKWIDEVYKAKHPDFRMDRLSKFFPKGVKVEIYTQGICEGNSCGYNISFFLKEGSVPLKEIYETIYKIFHPWPKKYIGIELDHQVIALDGSIYGTKESSPWKPWGKLEERIIYEVYLYDIPVTHMQLSQHSEVFDV